jgi:hypothetical protein
LENILVAGTVRPGSSVPGIPLYDRVPDP